MVLSIVISISRADGPKEGRITSNSCLGDLLHFFTLLGADRWEIYDKGTTRLESNGCDVYVAIGPRHRGDREKFLNQAKSYTEMSS